MPAARNPTICSQPSSQDWLQSVDFCSCINGEMGAAGVKQTRNLWHTKQTWCTTTKESTRAVLSHPCVVPSCPPGYFSQQSAYIWLAQWQHTGIGVEIAIVTARMTKGDMQVKRSCFKKLLNTVHHLLIVFDLFDTF